MFDGEMVMSIHSQEAGVSQCCTFFYGAPLKKTVLSQKTDQDRVLIKHLKTNIRDAIAEILYDPTRKCMQIATIE